MPPSPASSLGDLERDVMDRLWESSGPRTVREVHAELATSREIAYTTVMTVLDRLSRKDLVSRVQVGRAYAYSPVHSRAELTAEAMHQAMSVDGLDRTAALVHFADRVTPIEAAALAEALRRVNDGETDPPGS